MASVHRQPGKPYWYCSFLGPEGKWKFKSTKTGNRRMAEQICCAWDKTAKKARQQTLSPEKARQIIEDGVTEILEISGHPLPHATVKNFLKSWLKEKEEAGAEHTAVRYQGVVDQFLKSLGSKADQSLANISKQDIAAFRDRLLEKVSASTANTNLKILRAALNRAVKNEYIDRNPALLVDTIKRAARQERRAFSLPELKKLLEVANQDWKTAILIALYTGLRLQDVVGLTWNNLDLQRAELTVVTQKTGRTQILPLSKPLIQHLLSLPAGENPNAPLCPDLEGKASGNLSQQFYTLMQSVGLVPKRDHHAKSKRTPTRRVLQPVGFHALRHTATSLLKNAGVSNAVAMDIIGHDSEAVSRNYTHIDMETKRKAVDAMPDIFTVKLEPETTSLQEKELHPSQ